MGNGGFYGCLIEPQDVSEWWKESAETRIFLSAILFFVAESPWTSIKQKQTLTTHNANRYSRVRFETSVWQRYLIYGRNKKDTVHPPPASLEPLALYRLLTSSLILFSASFLFSALFPSGPFWHSRIFTPRIWNGMSSKVCLQPAVSCESAWIRCVFSFSHFLTWIVEL